MTLAKCINKTGVSVVGLCWPNAKATNKHVQSNRINGEAEQHKTIFGRSASRNVEAESRHEEGFGHHQSVFETCP